MPLLTATSTFGLGKCYILLSGVTYIISVPAILTT